MATGAELTYNTAVTAMQMANAIFGVGTVVTGATFTGDTRSRGTFANGDAVSPGTTPGNTGVILSTGRIVDYTQSGGDPNRSAQTTTDTSGPNNNAQFNALAGTNTYDAAILDVDFIPTGSVMTLNFTFSSEEFPEFAASQFNDTIGVWINGQVVPIQIGNGAINVTNLNGTTNQNMFVSNTADQFNTEMDGFTLTLKLTIPVNPGVVNSIRIGIADVADAQYDSNLLIKADSAQTQLVAIGDGRTMSVGQTKTLDVLANDTSTLPGTLVITHINGVAVLPGQTVTLPSGDQVRLNADMTITIITDADPDRFNFTYTVKNLIGQTDIGIVTIDTIPCFVAGTLIRTPGGDVPVEALGVGDMVETLDDGPQPLRWVGRRLVSARGPFAPVRIAAGTFGPHAVLMLSPQHRVMVRDPMVELLFGDAEVLIAAKDLVNGETVQIIEGGWVEYVHLLFDRHQVVWSQGLATESFLPGPQISSGPEQAVADEICAIFPEIDRVTGLGYSPAVRRALRPHEARVLMADRLAA